MHTEPTTATATAPAAAAAAADPVAVLSHSQSAHTSSPPPCSALLTHKRRLAQTCTTTSPS